MSKKYNSTKYRVVPMMEVIEKNLSSLNKVLGLLNTQVQSLPTEIFYACKEKNKKEKSLKPSKEFLTKIVDHIVEESSVVPKYNGSCEERKKLFYCKDKTVRKNMANEAKKLIEKIMIIMDRGNGICLKEEVILMYISKVKIMSLLSKGNGQKVLKLEQPI